MTLEQRLNLLAVRIGNYIRDNIAARLVTSGGTTGHVLTKLASGFGWVAPGSDPWTTIKLAADFTAPNSAAFTNISDGTTTLQFTPPANSDWELAGVLIFETATNTNYPRPGINIGANANNGYGAISIVMGGATANATIVANGGWKNNGAVVNIQGPAAGGAVAANTPVCVDIRGAGRSGNNPQPITLQLANETAAANMGKALRGSFLRWRAV